MKQMAKRITTMMLALVVALSFMPAGSIALAAENAGDADATIEAIAEKTYTGKAFEPAPAVKLGATTLKAGTDYTLSYKDNEKVGTATVTATGKGNYAGSVSKKFTIAKAPNPMKVVG